MGVLPNSKDRFLWFFLASTFKEMFPHITTEWHYFATSHGEGSVWSWRDCERGAVYGSS
ncbi:Hypothetical protein FKW44_021920 [Caligus rogercresseyi]|uniref:Uncharacterized protein n=1 Tax=Caligus rogercresseyi TaxID=217165 RepID=A0A7T8GS11_CALRO|nr:Hypothetical protein FKW44_021920 [Caligus rogercresseyi]